MIKIWQRLGLISLAWVCMAAQASTSTPSWLKSTGDDQFTGPYVGVQLGANASNIHDTNSITSSPISHTQGSSTYTLNATGVEGGLLLGYGKRLPYHLYMGSEVYAMLNSASATASFNPAPDVNTAVKYKMLGSFGVNFDPGVFLTPTTMLYGVAGPTFALFNSTPQTADAGFEGSNNSFTKVLPGARFGLGLNTAIYKNLNLRGEYDFSAFPTFNDGYASRAAAGIGGQMNARYYVLSNEALLSLVYHI